jgi:hypothetical protein
MIKPFPMGAIFFGQFLVAGFFSPWLINLGQQE